MKFGSPSIPTPKPPTEILPTPPDNRPGVQEQDKDPIDVDGFSRGKKRSTGPTTLKTSKKKNLLGD